MAKDPSKMKPGGPKPVGYGAKGHPFYNQQKYDQSPSGRLHGAGGPPKLPLNASPGQKAHFAHAEVSKPTPVAKTPSGMVANPVARARGVK